MPDNKSIALEFQKRLADADLDGALALASPDAAFIGPDGRSMAASEFRALFEGILPKVAGPFDMRSVGATAEGERVALQMTGSVPLKNGKVYNNRYHFLFIIKDQKIVEMTEYCDVSAVSVFADQ